MRTRRPFTLEVTFSDGSCRAIDLKEHTEEEDVFASLRDYKAFSAVEIDPIGRAEWPSGASLAPEFLRWGPHIPKGCPCGDEPE